MIFDKPNSINTIAVLYAFCNKIFTKFLLSLFILRRQLCDSCFFQDCGTFNTIKNKKYHNFERNQNHTSAPLKWTDFINFSYLFRWFLSTPTIVSSAVCDSLSTKFFAPCLLHLLLQLGCAILLRLFFSFFPFFQPEHRTHPPEKKMGKERSWKRKKNPMKIMPKKREKRAEKFKNQLFCGGSI